MKYTEKQYLKAYQKGLDDGADQKQYCNPYNEVDEFELWTQYDGGYSDGFYDTP